MDEGFIGLMLAGAAIVSMWTGDYRFFFLLAGAVLAVIAALLILGAALGAIGAIRSLLQYVHGGICSFSRYIETRSWWPWPPPKSPHKITDRLVATRK
jgi:hypothetical protein